MDTNRFDELTKALGAGTSRRRAVTGALGALLVAAGFAEVGATGKKGKDGKNGKGGNGGKMTICHCPPGNPDNCHTITIGAKAAWKHLQKHDDDYQGECDDPVDVCEGDCYDDDDCRDSHSRSNDEFECRCTFASSSRGNGQRGTCEKQPRDTCRGECDDDDDCDDRTSSSNGGDEQECFCNRSNHSARGGSGSKGTCERRREECAGECDDDDDCDDRTSSSNGDDEDECFCKLPEASASTGNGAKGTCEQRPRDICPGRCNEDHDCLQPLSSSGNDGEVECFCDRSDIAASTGGGQQGVCKKRRDVCPGRCYEDDDCRQPNSHSGNGDDIECFCDVHDVGSSSGASEQGYCKDRKDVCPGACEDYCEESRKKSGKYPVDPCEKWAAKGAECHCYCGNGSGVEADSSSSLYGTCQRERD